MHVRSVTLLREGAYGFDGEKVDPTKPFICKVSIVGQTGKHELTLPPEVSTHIMYLIAEELAEAGKRVAAMMQAQAFIEGDGEVMEGLPSPRKPPCKNHPGRISITNLDGEDLCKECADAWSRSEGNAARDLDDEIPF